LLYYVTLTGVETEVAIGATDDHATGVRLVADHSDRCLLEVTTGADGTGIARSLVEQGANVQSLRAEPGRARVVCETAPSADVRGLVGTVTAGSPTASLAAKREVESPVRTQTEFQRALEEQLTDRQLSVLRAAYHAGYFDWPRGSTAEELADSIGVSSPTLHNHLRRGQRKLLGAFFEDDRG
jgi:predicted DNA binding protein